MKKKLNKLKLNKTIVKVKFYFLLISCILISCSHDELEVSDTSDPNIELKSLTTEKLKFKTAIVVNATKDEDITEKIIKTKEDQILDKSTTIKVKSIGFNNQTSQELLSLVDGKVILKKDPNNQTTDKNIVSEVVTLALSNGKDEVTLEVLVVINPDYPNKKQYYIPNELDREDLRATSIPRGKTFLGVGYDIINSSYINRDDAKLNRPILDINKLNAANAINQVEYMRSNWNTISEESISTLFKQRDRNFINTTSELIGGLFSAEINIKYKYTHNNKQTNKYSNLRAQHTVLDEFLTSSSPYELRDYITDDFLYAVNNHSAAYIIDNYGSHVFTRCYQGGSAEFNFSYSGSEVTTTSEMTTIINATYKFITSNNTVINTNTLNDVKENTYVHFMTAGGDNNYSTSLEQFEKNYSQWVNSIKKYPDLCGIGNFDNSLIPISEIVKLINPIKAKQIEIEFEKRLYEHKKMLENRHMFITFINVWEAKQITNTPPYPYTNYVRTDMYKRDGGIVLDANHRAKGEHIRIGYKSEQKNMNRDAIADIVILRGKNALAPFGYTKINYDLNKGAKGDFLYLAYRKVTPNDTKAIDFIGAYDGKNQPSSTLLNSNWSWVNYYNSSEWADLNKGAKGNFIYLTVHKVDFKYY